MATLVDESSSTPRGSYFDVLTEKYPDLAPETQPNTDAVSPLTRVETRSDGKGVPVPSSRARVEPGDPSTVEVVESSWLATTVLVLLALALLFPPALLWRPSWLPSEEVAGVGVDVPIASEVTAMTAPESPVSSTSGSDTQGLRSVVPEHGGGPEELVARGEATASTEKEPLEAISEGASLPESPEASEVEPPRAALVAELPEVTPTSSSAVRSGETGKDSNRKETLPGVLEVATAGPRILPARRLVGEAPKLSSPVPGGGAARVRMRTHINPRGDVIGVDILKGVSESADREMAEALRRWQYAPATVDGRPVSSQQEVVFVLPTAGVTEVAENEPVEPARRRSSPLPGYTTEAWVQGTEGDVELLASIDSRGDVTGIEVIQGLPYGLTESAVDAVERWKFDPARHKGQAVSSTQRLRLRFNL